MPSTTSEIEPHPIFHEFTVVNDVIAERNSRRVPMLIRREERCEHCNTRRVTRINVRQWTVVGSRQYKYPKGIKIVRISKHEWLKRQFLANNALDNADLLALR